MKKNIYLSLPDEFLIILFMIVNSKLTTLIVLEQWLLSFLFFAPLIIYLTEIYIFA